MKNFFFVVALVSSLTSLPAKAECISIAPNLSATVPAADFMGTTVSFSLRFYANPADATNLYFQLNDAAEIPHSTNTSATISSSLAIDIPCVDYQGNQFAVGLAPYANPSDPSWYYWRLSNVQEISASDTPEPNPEEKPTVLPDFASLSLYASNSPFNTKISANPSIDPDSRQLVDSLVSGGAFLIVVKKFSSPVYFASEKSKVYAVEIACGAEWGQQFSHLSGVPIPDHAEPANDGGPGDGEPTGCAKGPDQDNHMVVLDLKNRCEYDFWQARKTSNGWQASWGSSVSLDSTGVYPTGMSTRGSGFAFLGGVIWPDELRNGHIDHALAFNYPFTKAGGPVAPATDSDGEKQGEHLLPEGALLQLDPQLDLAALPLTGYERTIANALQTYGMYLVDDGSNGIGLYAVDPKSVKDNPYAGILPDEDWPYLPNIPLDRFRVIRMGAQDANFADKLTPHTSGCGSYVKNL